MTEAAQPNPLVCPVRGCRLPLESTERGLGCAARHHFDRSRSGYVNLLTPQDRRSPRAGDSKASVLARRSLHERGLSEPLLRRLIGIATALDVEAGQRLLDVGCGDGYFLDGLAAALGLDGFGVDLSVPAVDLASRRYKSRTFVVANADRTLPLADASFDVVTSIDACKSPGELRRVLRGGGLLLLVVPGADDLAELREAVLGRAVSVPRAERALERFSDAFELALREEVTEHAMLDRAALLDLLAGTYRGARRREQERIDTLAELGVTLSHSLLALRPRLRP